MNIINENEVTKSNANQAVLECVFVAKERFIKLCYSLSPTGDGFANFVKKVCEYV